MLKKLSVLFIVAAIGLTCVPAFAADSDADKYLGYWALDLPGGGAGWMGVVKEYDPQGRAYLDAGILWGGGSVTPVAAAFLDQDGRLALTRVRTVNRGDKGAVREVRTDGSFVRENHLIAQPNKNRTHTFVELLLASVDGNYMELTRMIPSSTLNGKMKIEKFSGKRIKDLPAPPDLDKVRYGDAIELFNGKNLDGWKLTNPRSVSGWFVEDGVLNNDPKQEKGKPRIHYGNIRTEAEFEDFNLKLEAKVPASGNSGIYLRGIYEVQVMESYGQPIDPHHMGSVYSRIAPRVAAERPADVWQTVDITLCDRHVTVILNGVKIIDNEPLLGCTGGALTPDEFRPGPIYLQGDHTGVSYRNVVLTPIIK
jgi:3-keto-disaccharide hydrolase